ncbi:glycosyltransferase [Lithospermum erythrorhizon]|uniref:Glycosyltransferase n=1 Tax=Lithospermum erythrorhizon TaxID=34254 RepID=A0AAV3QVI0_LITER
MDYLHCKNGAHILLFPFPTSGHIIPILDLANQLLYRGLTITILVTPENLKLLDPLVSTHSSNTLHTLVIPFPSATSFVSKLQASFELSQPILEFFESHKSPPLAIISDFFLGWTNQLACQLGIPRLVFWASSAKQSLVVDEIWRNLPLPKEQSMVSFTNLPSSFVLPKWQASELVSKYIPGDPFWECFKDTMLSNFKSWGAVYNSFMDLEDTYVDYINKEMGHDRVFLVGPLLPQGDNLVESFKRGGSSVVQECEIVTWLDSKAENSVLYVCFGSRTELPIKQTEALAHALDKSGVNFIWCVRGQNQEHITKEYEDGVSGRGLIIRGWAPQVVILRNKAVGAFVTHCGWNSILEGISAGVLMLTWPMGADQFANAKDLIDELGVAEEACEGGQEIVPDVKTLSELFVMSVSEDCPKREKVLHLRDGAVKAVKKYGSSSKDLDSLVRQLSQLK